MALWLIASGILVASPWNLGTKYVITTSNINEICTDNFQVSDNVINSDGTLNYHNVKQCLDNYHSWRSSDDFNKYDIRVTLEEYKRNGLVVVVVGWILVATGVILLLYIIIESLFRSQSTVPTRPGS